jgi:hypothetical protein
VRSLFLKKIFFHLFIGILLTRNPFFAIIMKPLGVFFYGKTSIEGELLPQGRTIFGGYYERKNYPRLLRMQTEKLRHHEEQKERSRQTGNEQVLSVLPQAHPAQRNQIKNH